MSVVVHSVPLHPPHQFVRSGNQARFEEVLTASPSKICGNVADALMGHMVKVKAIDGILEVKSGSRGKPQTFTRISASNVPSNLASTSTLRRRSAEIERVSQLISGSDDGVRAQEVAGLKRLSKDEQTQLLIDSGMHPKTPSEGTLLAIKADMNLPWNQIRQLKRWLSSFGVELESEKKARSFIAHNVPEYIAKEVPMTKKDGSMVMATMVYFPSLITIVTHYLDLYESCGMADMAQWLNS